MNFYCVFILTELFGLYRVAEIRGKDKAFFLIFTANHSNQSGKIKQLKVIGGSTQHT
jgi:hypothetical protein